MEIQNNIKKFELNMNVLSDFDNVMSMPLDQIDELKITSIDTKSKLLNVISLCSNIHTLIIEADQRLNTDKVFQNIFKPELVEKLILNNVKLPTAKSLKKYTNLKTILLYNIRFCNIKEFLMGIVNPEKIEEINFENTDMINVTDDELKLFSGLKYISINNAKNHKIKNLEFLKNNANLMKIDICKTQINISQINQLLKCNCKKNIDIEIEGADGKILKNCNFSIFDNISKINIPINELLVVSNEIQLFRINKINLFIDEPVEDTYFVKILKKQKKNTNIIIKDFSCLDVKQAKKVQDILKLENIYICQDDKYIEYNIDIYIKIRSDIDNILNKVSKHVTEVEKFLEIYKFLGNKLTIVSENANLNDETCLMIDVANILQNCLKCINIDTNIIKGTEFENNKEHLWNQVKLDNKWYNVDLGLDIKNIKKNTTEYCLLCDEEFIETHMPKLGKNNYCPENFNEKIINVFFKTGLFSDKLISSYIEIIIEKIKKIFNFNKKQEKILLLPSGENDKKDIL